MAAIFDHHVFFKMPNGDRVAYSRFLERTLPRTFWYQNISRVLQSYVMYIHITSWPPDMSRIVPMNVILYMYLYRPHGKNSIWHCLHKVLSSEKMHQHAQTTQNVAAEKNTRFKQIWTIHVLVDCLHFIYSTQFNRHIWYQTHFIHLAICITLSMHCCLKSAISFFVLLFRKYWRYAECVDCTE